MPKRPPEKSKLKAYRVVVSGVMEVEAQSDALAVKSVLMQFAPGAAVRSVHQEGCEIPRKVAGVCRNPECQTILFTDDRYMLFGDGVERQLECGECRRGSGTGVLPGANSEEISALAGT